MKFREQSDLYLRIKRLLSPNSMGNLFKVILAYKSNKSKFLGLIMFYSKQLKKIKKIKHCFFSRKHGYSKGSIKALIAAKDQKTTKKSS